jgi:ferredoxin
MSLKEELKAFGRSIGCDEIGVCSAEAFEAKIPHPRQKPSTCARGHKTLIAFAIHMLSGAFATFPVKLQGANAIIGMDIVEETQFRLSEWLEARGHRAFPLPAEAAFEDLDQRKPMGSLDFKWICEEAGIGTAGLELNLLTPSYGPRCYLGVVMTDAEMEPDPPLARDLCPGLSCGRCAAVCPIQAIPLAAGRRENVRAYRYLDKGRCTRGAQRIGIKVMHVNLASAVQHRGGSAELIDALVDNHHVRDFWQSMNSKVGAYAACFECETVCPVGTKDFKRMFEMPYRKADLPREKFKKTYSGDRIEVRWIGPPEERQKEYVRANALGEIIARHAGISEAAHAG